MALSKLAVETRFMPALEQAALVRDKKVSALELLDAAIERYEAYNPKINAVNIVWLEHARELAKRDDATRDATSGKSAPFRSVPTLFKDLHTTYAGQRISNGNKALKNAGYIATRNTVMVDRYLGAGFVPFGRTNSC